MFLCVFVLKTAAKPTKGSVYGDSRIPDDIGAGDVCGNCPAVGESACDGRRLRRRRSSTALATVVDCADDGRHAKMEEWKGARAGRRGIRDVSNERAETRLIEKSYTDEEIAAIEQKHKIGV